MADKQSSPEIAQEKQETTMAASPRHVGFQHQDAPADGHAEDSTTEVNSEKAEPSSEQTPVPASGDPEQANGANNKPFEERSRAKIVVIMAALCMAVFLAALDVTIIATALPSISRDFHSSSGFTWVGSAYLLASAATTPLWGKLSDIFGRKPMLLLANVIFFIGSLLAGVSVSIGMLIVSRAIQGVGNGGLITLVNTVIGDLFSPRRRGAYYGVIGGVWALASSLGPIVGGAFTQKVTWRWCFYINLPFDGVAFAVLLLFLDLKTPRTPFWEGIKAIDWLGTLLITGGTLMFLLGLSYGGIDFPWDSATTLCLIIFGGLCFVLFGVSQVWLSKYPLMPPNIFRHRSNLASLAACFLQSFVFVSGAYYLPLYFQTGLGATPILSGVYLLPTSISLAIASVSTGIFIRKTGKYLPPIWFGFILQTLGYGLFIDLDSYSNWAKIIIFQIFGGLGVGPNFQAPLIALQSKIAPRDIASATAAFGFTRNLGTAISVVIGGVIFQNQLPKKAADIPALATSATSAGPGAALGIIQSLPPAQRPAGREAFSLALQTVWIVVTAISAVGLLNTFLIGKQTLSKDHTETATGMEAMKKAKQEEQEERAREKAEKEERRRSRKSGDLTGEKPSVETPRRSGIFGRKSVDVEAS